MTPQQIIKAVIPEATTDLCEHILLERTSFGFGNVTAKTIYKAASRFRMADVNNIRFCELCDNKADVGDSVCDRCRKALDDARHRAW